MPSSVEESKKEVERLCLKLKQFQEAGQIKRLSEEETKKTFITPLFRALGWDMENDRSLDEVINEERISKGRVDYSFRINSIPKFFLEAKALNKGLDETKDASQAINYAWHKGTSWAVLTDFQTLIIYNAEVKDKNLSNARFKTLTFDQFVDHFDELWLLSKQGFEEGLLDKAATNWNKKMPRTKVGDQLLSELMYYRTLLSKSIVKNNDSKNLTQEDIDESVQRIIDRLIFIRTTEDRNIEPPTLSPIVREFEEKKRGKATTALNEVYLKFDETYNSKLFTFNSLDLSQRHLCETLDIDNEILLQVIKGLYESRDGLTHYDFSAIDADVLGNIYEQYLSHILKKTEKRAKVESKEAHRKEQGIYYTPTYIVDYIVRNTLGEMLKNKKPEDVDNIKVLDMACGSGSFLLKSFDVLDEYYKKRDKNYAQSKLDTRSEASQITRRTQILKNNIYGVDLDPKAVEIAQLNLLLKAAETKHRLPDLRENIKCGNSLIDDQLIAGDHAFDWNKEFPQIMSKGGFDVIIGNPPYGYRGIPTPEIKSQYSKVFSTCEGNFDMYRFFIERSLTLLKDGGVLGFIIPNTFLSATSYKRLRRLILEKTKIVRIYDLGLDVFDGVTLESTILLLEKKKPIRNSIRIAICRSREIPLSNPTKQYEIPQSQFLETKDNTFNILVSDNLATILSKIERKSVSLEEITYVTVGINTGYIKSVLVSPTRLDARYHKMLSGRDISRYSLKWPGEWILYDKKVVDHYGEKGRTLPSETIFDQEKILVQRTRRGMARKLICALDTEQYYNLNRLSNIVLTSKDYSIRYLLGLLNSKLMDAYFQIRFNEYEVKPAHLRQLPIRKLTLKEQSTIIALVEEMIILKTKLATFEEKHADDRISLEKKIAETDAKIDSLVYDLYGLTAEERRVVEAAIA